MFRSLKNLWKRNPAVRLAARNLVVAGASYVAGGLLSGFTDWRSFAASAITTTITTVLGLTTPLEPFVGVNKAAGVRVPVQAHTPDGEPPVALKRYEKLGASADPDEAAHLGQRVVVREDTSAASPLE
jgi:hypothetical protein